MKELILILIEEARGKGGRDYKQKTVQHESIDRRAHGWPCRQTKPKLSEPRNATSSDGRIRGHTSRDTCATQAPVHTLKAETGTKNIFDILKDPPKKCSRPTVRSITFFCH